MAFLAGPPIIIACGYFQTLLVPASFYLCPNRKVKYVMIKKIGIILVILLLLACGLIYWENQRLTIAEQEIEIENLPETMEGFRIMQITDLHEKEFGKGQRRLIDLINSVEYDAIVFTGDMLDDVESTNYGSFYSILEGIENKEYAWFVPGNTDPYSYVTGEKFGKSDFIKGMEQRGVKLLESFDVASNGEEKIHFLNYELSIAEDPEYLAKPEGTVLPPYATDKDYLAYQNQLWSELSEEDLGESDTLIAINHYPVPDMRSDYIASHPLAEETDYDLLIAGHYHGGQIRLPFIGALFIPDPWYEPNSFFPPQGRVKGLWEYNGRQQYVSTGLGSSDALPLINFRLFNPPEVNVIELIHK